MYPQYLQPDLVLFGEFYNPKIECEHPYSFKDGELIVHQAIDRKTPKITDETGNFRNKYDAAYEEYLS